MARNFTWHSSAPGFRKEAAVETPKSGSPPAAPAPKSGPPPAVEAPAPFIPPMPSEHDGGWLDPSAMVSNDATPAMVSKSDIQAPVVGLGSPNPVPTAPPSAAPPGGQIQALVDKIPGGWATVLGGSALGAGGLGALYARSRQSKDKDKEEDLEKSAAALSTLVTQPRPLPSKSKSDLRREKRAAAFLLQEAEALVRGQG